METMLKQYVKRGNKKEGVLVSYSFDGYVGIGWSKAHSQLDPFDKEMGERIALGRALVMPSVENVPHSFKKDFEKFVNRCRRYYKNQEFPQFDEV